MMNIQEFHINFDASRFADLRKRIATAPDNQLTKEEPDYKRTATEWMQKEGAHINIRYRNRHVTLQDIINANNQL